MVSTQAVEGPPRAPVRLRAVDGSGVLLAGAVAAALLADGRDAVAIVALAAAALVAPALSRIDLAERRLPNALTLPLLAVAALAAAARLVTGDLAGLAALACAAMLLAMATAGGMGMGDVKLGAALALACATLGWGVPLAGLAASVVVGGIAGAAALATGRGSVAFGPWLVVGHGVAVAAAAAGAV